MATIYWLGTADAVAQVDTATPANVEIGDIFNLLVGGSTIATFTATVASVANVTNGLTAAWNASTHPYATGVTATDSTTHVTLTADTAGLPFTVTSSTTDGGGNDTQTLTIASSTACSGPNHWDTAANWSGGAVPVANDVVIVKDCDINICWGLDQSAVALDGLDIRQTYTGRIGLDYRALATSADGETTDTSKVEYRDLYLKICVTAADGPVELGRHYGPGSPVGSDRIMLDLHTTAAEVIVYNTGTTPSGTETGRQAVRLLCANDDTDIHVKYGPGGVGIANEVPGEVSNLRTVAVHDSSSGTRVIVGAGTTFAAGDGVFTQMGGVNVLQSAGDVQEVRCYGGTLTAEGQFEVSGVTIQGGIFVSNNTDPAAGVALGTINLYGGMLDGTQSMRARTWSTINRRHDTTVSFDAGIVTNTTLNQPTGPTQSVVTQS